MMIEINLVPDIKQELIKAQRIRAKVILGSILVGVVSISTVVLLAVYIFGVQAISNTQAGDAIREQNTKLKSVTDLSKTLTIQNQLALISQLNGNRHIDSRIFDLLIAVNPPAPNDVIVSSVTVDSSLKRIVIEGQASNSYAAVEVYKKTIEGARLQFTPDGSTKQQTITIASDINSDGTTHGADSSGKTVSRFTISFTYTDELLSLTSKNPTIIITTNPDGNVTDSYLGIPLDIFKTTEGK
ncbi:MAG: hypothetical protein WCH58_04105 [Candidatus Saccharibacteria bacterium]